MLSIAFCICLDYLHKKLLSVLIDERDEGLGLPGNGHQLGQKHGRRLDRVLLRHRERVYGTLYEKRAVQVLVDKEAGLLLQHLCQGREETVNQVRIVGHCGARLNCSYCKVCDFTEQGFERRLHGRFSAVEHEKLLDKVKRRGLGCRAVAGHRQGYHLLGQRPYFVLQCGHRLLEDGTDRVHNLTVARVVLAKLLQHGQALLDNDKSWLVKRFALDVTQLGRVTFRLVVPSAVNVESLKQRAQHLEHKDDFLSGLLVRGWSFRERAQ